MKPGGQGIGPRSDPVSMGSPLVEVRNLVKEFPLRAGLFRRRVGAIQAVSDISFTVAAGQTLGLVGESGSGKSTTGRALLHLDPPTSGEVRFRGDPLDDLHPEALRRARREMQMVFQDPFASLNPRHTVGAIVREPLDVHRVGTPDERRERVRDLLERVGLEAPTSFPAVSGRGWESPGRWRRGPRSWWRTSPSPRWTSPSRRRS